MFAAELYIYYSDGKFIILVKAVTEFELSYAIERGIYKLPVRIINVQLSSERRSLRSRF